MSPPVGNVSLFKRFFGLAENQPLYLMLGIACALAVYTPIRHLMTASDVALDRNARNHGDDLAENPRHLLRAKTYEGGILAWAASFKKWPEVFPLPKGTPNAEHFLYERWPAPRPFNVPKPE